LAKVRKRTWTTKTGERIAWVADYFAPGPDGKKRRHTKTFPTKKEANAWLAHTVVEIKQGTHTPAHLSPTVLEAGEAWVAQAEADGLERSTVCQYRQLLGLHIRPFLGHVKLAELTPGAVQSFRNVLVRNGRSRVMADRIVWGLGSILADAMANGRVARNVVREQARQHRRRARIEKRHKRQLQVGVDIPTKDEIRAMLEHAGRLRPLLVTAIFTGLRASELRGLTLGCGRPRAQGADGAAARRPLEHDWLAEKRLGKARSSARANRCKHAEGMETALSPIRRRWRAAAARRGRAHHSSHHSNSAPGFSHSTSPKRWPGMSAASIGRRSRPLALFA
jgi:integrase